MGDYSPVNAAGTVPTRKTASATITGGQLVTASGDNTVAPSTTGDHSIGVAAHDAVNGGTVAVWPNAGVEHEITIQGTVAITANNPIVAGTTGTINTAALATAAAAGTLLGIATRSGTGGSGTGKARYVGVA